jgi:hypothetical protein
MAPNERVLLTINREPIADAFAIWAGIFLPPEIAQMDNGREFKGALLRLIRRIGSQVVNRSPRYPQSQGLVEQANGVMEHKLRAWKVDNSSVFWHLGLPEIQMAMNTQYHETIKTTPYEVVFRSKYTLQLWRKTWLDANKRLSASLHHEDPELPIENESTIPLYPMTTAEVEAGTQFVDGRPAEPIKKTIGPPEGLYTEGESLGTTRGITPLIIPGISFDRPLILSPRRQIPLQLPDTATSAPLGNSAALEPPIAGLFGTEEPSEEVPVPVNLEDEDLEPEDHLLSVTRDNITIARDKMVAKYHKSHTIESFVIGDIVLIKLPREIRTATDQRKLFGRVIGALHQPVRYKVQTKWGIIDRSFATSQLGSLPNSVAEAIEIGNIQTPITLSKAAKENSSGERVVVSCQCTGACNTNRCRCFKNQVRCSVHCHREEHDCGFLKELIDRTERNLVKKDKETAKKRTPRATRATRATRAKRARANTAGDEV